MCRPRADQLEAAGGLMGLGVPQSLELGQEIAQGLPGNQLSDGFAAAGDHHRLALLYRVEQARQLGLGLRHRDLSHGIGHRDDQL